MDISAIAAAAAAAMGTYLIDIGSGVAGKFKDTAVERLYTLAAERLRISRTGQAALEDLRESPADPARATVVSSVLARAAAEDPQFADQLGQAVQAVTVSQGHSEDAAVHHQANVHTGGRLSMLGSVIAGGDVDKSRRTMKIGLGGLLALLLVSTGVVAAVHQIGGSTTASILGSWVGVCSDDPNLRFGEQGSLTFEEGGQLKSRSGSNPEKTSTYSIEGNQITLGSGSDALVGYFTIDGGVLKLTALTKQTSSVESPSYWCSYNRRPTTNSLAPSSKAEPKIVTYDKTNTIRDNYEFAITSEPRTEVRESYGTVAITSGGPLRQGETCFSPTPSSDYTIIPLTLVVQSAVPVRESFTFPKSRYDPNATGFESGVDMDISVSEGGLVGESKSTFCGSSGWILVKPQLTIGSCLIGDTNKRCEKRVLVLASPPAVVGHLTVQMKLKPSTLLDEPAVPGVPKEKTVTIQL